MTIFSLILQLNCDFEPHLPIQPRRVDRTNAWEDIQRANLSVMPEEIDGIEPHARYYRLSLIIEQLTGRCIAELNRDLLTDYTERLLSASNAIYNGTCGKRIPNHRDGRIRFDLRATTFTFPCNSCSRRRHDLRYHLQKRFRAHLEHPQLHSSKYLDFV